MLLEVLNLAVAVTGFVLIVISSKKMLPVHMNGGYPFLLIVYSYSTVLLSLVTLEFGFYITESENYSHLNGAAISYVALTAISMIGLSFWLKIFTRIHRKCSSKGVVSYQSKIILINFMLIGIAFYLVIALANVILSPNPFNDTDVNRFNFWDTARFPWVAAIIGERGMPIALFLGCVANEKKFVKSKNVVALFAVYLTYLILLGHRFSPLLLAGYFYFMPKGLARNIEASKVAKCFLLIMPILILYVLYLYSNMNTGIVIENGGALGGAFYRVGVLQGQVYWNSWEIFLNDENSVENFYKFMLGGFDGLEMAMYAVAPSNAADYINDGVRFTAAYPAFLLLMPPFISIFIFASVLIVYPLAVLRAYILCRENSVFRLYFYITILYFYHFALTMGDLRFLASYKIIILIILIFFVEFLIRPTQIQEKRLKKSIVAKP
jgi:hypothetical protein